MPSVSSAAAGRAGGAGAAAAGGIGDPRPGGRAVGAWGGGRCRGLPPGSALAEP